MSGPTDSFDVEAQAPSSPMIWIFDSQSFRRTISQALHRFRRKAPSLPPSAHQIEDDPCGYPRFSGLMASHPSFCLFRRFGNARTRLLLFKQDRVSILEARLLELDRNESRLLFLSSNRRDRNPDRQRILLELDMALKDYDDLLERSQRMNQLPQAPKRDRQSLLNWIESTRCISRDEVSFLHERDLCGNPNTDDHGLTMAESFVESLLIRIYALTKTSPQHSMSRDKRVFIYRGSGIRNAARMLLSWVIIGVLIAPVLIIRTVNGTVVKIICVAIASCLSTLLMVNMTRSRAAEVFIGGATYAALLVVFVSGTAGESRTG